MLNLATDRHWPEEVVLEGHGRALSVRSTRDAALCLENHWPLERGDAKDAALHACERVLDGQAASDEARNEFIRAAQEAGFKLRSWTEQSEPLQPNSDGGSTMNIDKDEWIRNRAYYLWEQDGKVGGRHDEHWQQAEREWDDFEGLGKRAAAGDFNAPDSGQNLPQVAVDDLDPVAKPKPARKRAAPKAAKA